VSGLRERTLELLAEWIPIRSVAGDAGALRLMAATVAARLRAMGGTIVADGLAASPPVVHARFDRGAPVTIMLYNMYDVMPAEEAGWAVPPFSGGIVEMPAGPSYVGRGAENNKGPLAGMLVALEALLPGLAANVEVIVEGEEETGSGALRRYLAAGTVRHCAAALFPSFCEYGGGPPRIYLGAKGIGHGRIRVAGGDWGGPRRPIHSSNISWIDSPAWRLVEALHGLAAWSTGRLGGVALPADAAPLLAALAATFDPAAELRFRSSERFALAGTTAERLEAVLTTSSLNLAELRSDPPGGRAVIPALAEARFDLRVPPGVDIGAEIARLRARLPAGAELVLEDAYPGHCFGTEAPGVAALVETYRAAGFAPQVWPWAIGAMPAYAFAPVADSILIGGLGRGGNAHTTDEFVTLDGLDRFLASLLAWLPATVAHATSPRGA
jgi:acetylornithine deacetylase/succinyl-diaminopimelate desuccinylase-like protein